MRAELAIQTAQYARFIAAEATDAAIAAQAAYEEMRSWEKPVEQPRTEPEAEAEPEAAELHEGITVIESRRAA